MFTTKVYPFDELSDDAKETAIECLSEINVDYEWWDSIFDDAAQVGIKIEEFDIDRSAFCHGIIEDIEETVNLIVESHGDMCETYKTAKAFIDAIPRNEDATDDDYNDIDNEFRLSILEDYRIIFQKEYEYLTSEEAIIETIKANEYEFTADGKLY